jgi:hypothetical protein
MKEDNKKRFQVRAANSIRTIIAKLGNAMIFGRFLPFLGRFQEAIG